LKRVPFGIGWWIIEHEKNHPSKFTIGLIVKVIPLKI
jgi:hypothetical protein